MLDGFSAVTYALCKKYTNGAIQSIVESFSEGMHFQGSVATKDDLPDNPEKGDLYIIRDAGVKVVYDGNEWVEFEQNFYTKAEVDAKLREVESKIPSTVNYATKQALLEEINRAKSKENEIASSIPKKTSQLTNDSGFLTKHQDISGKADKSYVDSKLNQKQNKLTAGDHINITNNVISAVIPDLNQYATKEWVENKSYITADEAAALVDGKGFATEQWVEDKGYLTEHQSLANYYTKDELYDVDEVDELLDDKQNKLVAGENISIVDNVISAIGGGSSGKIGRTFTTDITVGHLASGTRINENDTIADILYRILYEVSPEGVSLFYGALDDLPTDVSGLTEVRGLDKSSLLTQGYTQNVAADDPDEGQWVVFAIPKEDGIRIKKIHNEGAELFDVPFTTYETATHHITSYLDTKQYDADLGGKNYVLEFEENQ